jgi:hypothetical protein
MTKPRLLSKAVIGWANASIKSEIYQEIEGKERNGWSYKTQRRMERLTSVLPVLSLRHSIPVICFQLAPRKSISRFI